MEELEKPLNQLTSIYENVFTLSLFAIITVSLSFAQGLSRLQEVHIR